MSGWFPYRNQFTFNDDSSVSIHHHPRFDGEGAAGRDGDIADQGVGGVARVQTVLQTSPLTSETAVAVRERVTEGLVGSFEAMVTDSE